MGAVDAVATICNTTPSAAALILGPVVHSNVTISAIMNKRRQLEDQILPPLRSNSDIVHEMF